MNYLLDTNACIALINGEPAKVRTRFQKEIVNEAAIFVPAITVFELWYGVAKSARLDFNTRRLESFLRGPIAIVPFEEEDARIAGSIRATLEASGKPIGAYDLLIAAQAISKQLALVTANVSEFSRIKGLHVEDWAKP